MAGHRNAADRNAEMEDRQVSRPGRVAGNYRGRAKGMSSLNASAGGCGGDALG
jgi:hypothetical protein